MLVIFFSVLLFFLVLVSVGAALTTNARLHLRTHRHPEELSRVPVILDPRTSECRRAPGRTEALRRKEKVSALKARRGRSAEASNRSLQGHLFLPRGQKSLRCHTSTAEVSGDFGGRSRVSSFLATLFLSLLHQSACGKLPRHVSVTAVLWQREPAGCRESRPFTATENIVAPTASIQHFPSELWSL